MTTLHLTMPDHRHYSCPDLDTVRLALAEALQVSIVVHNTWPGPRLVIPAPAAAVEDVCAEFLPAHHITWRCA